MDLNAILEITMAKVCEIIALRFSKPGCDASSRTNRGTILLPDDDSEAKLNSSQQT